MSKLKYYIDKKDFEKMNSGQFPEMTQVPVIYMDLDKFSNPNAMIEVMVGRVESAPGIGGAIDPAELIESVREGKALPYSMGVKVDTDMCSVCGYQIGEERCHHIDVKG